MKKIVSVLLVIVILVLSTGCQTVNITRGTIDGEGDRYIPREAKAW